MFLCGSIKSQVVLHVAKREQVVRLNFSRYIIKRYYLLSRSRKIELNGEENYDIIIICVIIMQMYIVCTRHDSKEKLLVVMMSFYSRVLF